MFDGRQKKETLRERERERRGERGLLVEEAVKQEEKDERIKKRNRDERIQHDRNSSY